MTNLTKWLIALPFAAVVALGLPAAVAGRLFWFGRSWTDLLYVGLTAGMWLVATAFVDVNRPRPAPDLANRLIPLGLILSVPLAVADRRYWLAESLPAGVATTGLGLAALAVLLGVSARLHLGRMYAPRAGHAGDGRLIQSGPYRWIRHPLYAAAILWSLGWPLILRSPAGALCNLAFLLPALRLRLPAEERELRRRFGEEYDAYCQRTWRLLPFVY